MAKKKHVRKHATNINNNKNEVHIHLGEKKRRAKQRKTTSKPRLYAPQFSSQVPQPLTPQFYVNRPQQFDPMTQSQRETILGQVPVPIPVPIPVKTPIQVPVSNETPVQVPVSMKTPVQVPMKSPDSYQSTAKKGMYGTSFYTDDYQPRKTHFEDAVPNYDHYDYASPFSGFNQFAGTGHSSLNNQFEVPPPPRRTGSPPHVGEFTDSELRQLDLQQYNREYYQNVTKLNKAAKKAAYY